MHKIDLFIRFNIINIGNLFQMFVVLVSWADQKVNLCRITDFWITETITLEEKALDSVQKGKITEVIDEETCSSMEFFQKRQNEVEQFDLD